MKENIINKSISIINNYYNYDDTKTKEIKYGLEVLYITITKTIVIILLAFILNLFKELIYLLLFYGVLRLFGHGLHAKKSFHCWISSLIVFILIPFLSKNILVSIDMRVIVSIGSIMIISLYAPADTEKKPMINKKKRISLKVLTIITSLVYIFFIFSSKNKLIINSLTFSLITECFLIHPLSYKLFDLEYQNYKTYKKS